MVLAMFAAAPAAAQAVPAECTPSFVVAGDTVDCTGFIGSQISIFNNDVTVNLNSATVDSATNQGLLMLGDNITANVSADSTLSGFADGIFMRSDGIGDVTVNSAGTLTGRVRAGLIAVNFGEGDINVTTTDTFGGLDPSAVYGIGAGMYVIGRADDVNVTSTGTSHGFNFGIFASNGTRGSIDVSANDAIGDVVNGIQIGNYYGGENLTLTVAGTAQGANNGVYARNYGIGFTTLDVANATGGYSGIDVLSQGTDLNITSTGKISGDVTGVNVSHNGSGAATVDVASVSSSGGVGINVQNAFGTDTNVTAETVTAYGTGINVDHDGSGDVNITVTDVTNDFGFGDGIFVDSSYSSGAVNITATGTVQSNADEAIEVIQYGSGAVNITANNVYGTESGGFGDGIFVRNLNGSEVNVTISGETNSGDDGVTVINYSGATNISLNNVTASGASSNSSGVNIFTRPGTTDILLNVAGAIEADWFGVAAYQFGTGSTTINVADVSTVQRDGIFVSSNYGASDVLVNATGTVTSTYSTGINVINTGAGSATVNAVDVVGGVNGIVVNGGSATSTGVTITSTGTVTGNGSLGILAQNSGYGPTTVSAVNVYGAYYGIAAVDFGLGSALSVTATGNVVGGYSGISTYNFGASATTINANNVTGTTGDAIFASSNYGGTGSVSVTTTGEVIGGANGVAVNVTGDNDVTVNTASGSVTGADNGIVVTGAGTSNIIVNGTVTGGTGAGINSQSSAGSTVNITAGAGANISSGSGLAIVDGDGDANVMIGNGAVVTGEIRLGNGSDVLTITSGADVMGVTVLDGGDDDSEDDGFVDTLNILGATVNLDASNIINWENFNIVDANVILSNLVAQEIDVCGGSTTLAGASAVDNVNGCVNDDGISVDGTTVVASRIEGAGGADTISVLGGASVTGSILGGGGGSDGSGGEDGGDIITIDTTGSVLSINAGAGDDSVLLMSGTVTANVATGSGVDNVLLDGATVGGNINTGNDGDMVRLLSGSAVNVISGGGEDTVYLAGADVGLINAGGDNDTIMLMGGTATAVQGAEGDDSILLDGATIAGAIVAGVGDDTVVLTSGSANNVRTNDGIDMVTLNGATIAGAISTGAGDDGVTLSAGTADSVVTEDGDDSIVLSGAMIATVIDAGAGNDMVGLSGGTVASVLTGTGMDTVSLSGAAVSGLIDTGADADMVSLSGGSAAGVVTGGGDDTVYLSGAAISGDIDSGDGADTVGLSAGSAANVLTGAGMDVVTLNGAAISGNIDTGIDNDTVTMSAGSAANVWTGDGDDVATLSGAAISGNVDMGNGDDVLNYDGGTYGALIGGAGTDTLNFGGAGQTLASTGAAGDPISLFETYNFNTGGWTLTGVHTGLQAVNFNAGTNTLDGQIVSALTTIGGGATLDAADGSLVSGNLTNSGTLTIAGAGTGTLTVDGDYTQPGNASFDVVSQTNHDQLVVNGTANLGGELSVNQGGGFFLGTVTLIDANSLNGTFSSDNVDGGGLLLSNALEYDVANANVNLTGSRTDASAISGLTANQIAVGNALIDDYLAGNTTGGLTSTALNVGYVGDATALGQTLEELHPEEVIAGLQTFQNSQALFTNALTKANDCSLGLKEGTDNTCGQKKVWGSIQYVSTDQEGTFSSVDYETDGVEITGGISNIGAGALRLGAAVGYSALDSEVGGNGVDEVKTEVFRVAGLATLDVGGADKGLLGHIDAVATYAGGKNDISRAISASAVSLSEVQEADPSVNGMSGLLRFTMEGSNGKYWPIKPFVQVGVDTVKQDAIDIGSGVTGLSIDEIDGTRTTLGAGASFEASLGGNAYAKLTGTGLFHSGDTDNTLSSSFKSTSAGSNFATIGEDVEQQFIIDFGAGTATEGGITIGANGFVEFGDLEGFGARLNVGHRF